LREHGAGKVLSFVVGLRHMDKLVGLR
jgi:hypothetical protein